MLKLVKTGFEPETIERGPGASFWGLNFMSFQKQQFLRSRVSLPEKLLAATVVILAMSGTLPFYGDNLAQRQYVAQQILKPRETVEEAVFSTPENPTETLSATSVTQETTASVTPTSSATETNETLIAGTWQPAPEQSPYHPIPVPSSPTPVPTPQPSPAPTPQPVEVASTQSPTPTPPPSTPDSHKISEKTDRNDPRSEMRRILEMETEKIQQAIENGRRYGRERGLLIEAHFALGTNQWSVHSADANETPSNHSSSSYQIQSARFASRSQAEVTWQFLSFRGPGDTAADPVFVFFPDGDVQGGAVHLGWEGFTRVLELDRTGRIQCRYEGNL
jgi:hypothetical protein